MLSLVRRQGLFCPRGSGVTCPTCRARLRVRWTRPHPSGTWRRHVCACGYRVSSWTGPRPRPRRATWVVDYVVTREASILRDVARWANLTRAAEVLGYSRQTVRLAAERLGITFRRRRAA